MKIEENTIRKMTERESGTKKAKQIKVGREMERKVEEEENRNRLEEKDANEGIDWAMGDVADKETDLSEKPYAVIQNEKQYIEDPKKKLRDWIERE